MTSKLRYVGKMLGDCGVTQRVALSDEAQSLEDLGIDIDSINGLGKLGAVISIGSDSSGNTYSARFALNVAPTQGDGGLGYDLTAEDGAIRLVSPSWLNASQWINAAVGCTAYLIITTEAWDED